MKLNTFKTNAPKFYAARNALIIKGGPGMGKSEVFDQIGAMMSKHIGKPFAVVTVILSGMHPIDLRGIGIPTKGDNGEFEVRFTKPSVWPNKHNVDVYVGGVLVPDYDGPVPDHGILFADEFGQSDADIQKVFAQVILDRRIGEHKLPDGWVVWAASNRMEDRAGVTKTLSHLTNRMMELLVDPDYEAWQEWAFANNIHPLVISFAKEQAGEVFRTSVPKIQGPYCTPRSLVLLSNNIKEFRTPGMSEIALPDGPIVTEMARGWLGEGIMPTFMSHIRLANDLPDVDDVIANPTKTKVPDRLDARFVMTTALSVHASSSKKMVPILTYVRRMDKELQILFVQSALARDPNVLAVPKFSEWVQENTDLILAANG